MQPDEARAEGRTLTPRGWHAAVASLCAVRVAIPLAVLAASGHRIPTLPPYDYNPLPGDAHGYYSAAREFMASWGRLGAPGLLLVAAALAIVAACVGRSWRRRPALRPWLVVVAAAAFSLAVALVITKMSSHTGAPVFGWPLLWSLPMLPYRAVGLPLDPDGAFVFGLLLLLVAEAVAVVATWQIGLRATGKRSVALLAAGLYAVWPFLSGALSGDHGGMNGSWFADSGLCGCTEPVSTAAVAGALVLLLAVAPGPSALAAAGVLLGFSTAVKLSNVLVVALALVLLAQRVGPRRTLPFLGGALAFVPIVAAWWSRGYGALRHERHVFPSHPFTWGHVVPNWTDSLFFSSRAVLALVPLILVGAVVLRRRWEATLLGLVIVVNALFYSFYAGTNIHPRFLLVALPAALVLWATGLAALSSGLLRPALDRARARGGTSRPSPP